MDWYEKIKEWYESGVWTTAMVEDALTKRKITDKQLTEILSA